MSDDAKYSITLADAAAVTAGFPFRGSIEDHPHGDTVVAQMRNASPERGIDWDGAVRTVLPGRKAPRFLVSGDVLFAARGANNYAVLVEGSPKRAVCSPHFFVVSVKDGVDLLPPFLAWQINQAPVQQQLDAAATGSHIRNIRRQALEDLRIVVPPMETQCTIIEFARAALAERRLLENLIINRKQQTDALALGLFKRKGVQE
ncbi:MAG: restriction endonuclease subunit S [Pseudomonadota bacterium]